MSKSLHIYRNPNPSKKEVGDCVVRACCLATGDNWDNVYKELCDLGADMYVMPNDKEAYNQYLLHYGFTYHGISVKKGGKRPTVNQIAKYTKNTDLVVVCRIANHIVTARDGNFLDLWDCGSKSLYGYWIKGSDADKHDFYKRGL